MYIITLGRKDSFRGAFEVENSLLWTSRAELLSVCYVVSLWGVKGDSQAGERGGVWTDPKPKFSALRPVPPDFMSPKGSLLSKL